MIQIQPKYMEKEKWLAFAQKENLNYEILEFSSAWLNQEISEEIFSWYRACGRCESVHGAFMDCYPVSPDFRIREISRERCEESCRQAERIGAEQIVFHSTALPFVRGGLEESWGRAAAEYYQSLAAKYNKRIYIENFNDVDYTPLVCMMRYVTDERVKLCLDIGHANYTRISLSEWLEALGDSIGYLHISDNEGFWDDHKILGDGTVDFKIADEWLRKQKRQIPITLEVPTIQSAEKSLSFLKENHLFGC